MVGVIAACYVVETVLDTPNPGASRSATPWCPEFAGTDSLLLAVGILGATVMPHVVFLHSHLTQGRIPSLDATAGAPRLSLRSDRRRSSP